ncbi:carbonic anhydrase [Bartonella ancashensis]|uniref:Carbonic anhydrase n=1 Tax=Bartonella ancashensis TaxID=1318743 RepID=A0A0M4LFY3_9HYPH|nr:carbonic anhydrase [Bartonella ancashensis]ALE03207.1 Carbonic anhydrase [Bartonella ancashensis]
MDHHFSSKIVRYQRLADEGQKPEIMVIACCDSRAAPEVIFDTDPGEIFVLRNIANLVPPFSPDDQHHATSAAIEFAVQFLEVKHIVILGHGRCGGIRTIIDKTCKPLSSDDFIGQWMGILAPEGEIIAGNQHMTETEKQIELERASIRCSLKNLETFPWLKVRKDQNILRVHGAWFDISSGELWTMEEKTGNFSRV